MAYPFAPGQGASCDGLFEAGNGFQGGPGGALHLEPLSPPSGVAVIPQTSGTTSFTAASTTYWAVTALGGDGTETPVSTVESYTQGNTPVPAEIQWTLEHGATAYGIYRGSASDSLGRIAVVAGGGYNWGADDTATGHYLDDGSITPGQAPPAINDTAGVTGGPVTGTYPTWSISASAGSLATGGTIAVGALGIVRVNPAAAVTGAILAAGTHPGQVVRVLNESANTITFAAVATSNVADGTTDVIAANQGATYVWDAEAATPAWVHV